MRTFITSLFIALCSLLNAQDYVLDDILTVERISGSDIRERSRGERPSEIPDTLYFPFQDGVQMIVINHFAVSQRIASWMDIGSHGRSSLPRSHGMAFMPNTYIFRNEEGEITSIFNNFRKITEAAPDNSRWIVRVEEIKFTKEDFKSPQTADTIRRHRRNYTIFYDFNDTIGNQTNNLKQDFWIRRIVGDNFKKGVFNHRGEVVLPAIYDWIFLELNKRIPNRIVINDGKFGFLDSTFSEITPIKFQLIEREIKTSSINNNHIITAVDSLWGIIDFSGNVLLDFKFASISEHNNAYRVRSPNGNIMTFDAESFKPVALGDFDHISFFRGPNIYLVGKNGRFGIVDTNGNLLLPLQYDNIVNTNAGGIIVEQKNRFGVLNQDFQLVIPIQYDEVTVSNESRNFIVKQKNRYGIFDRDFKIAIPVQYDTVIYRRLSIQVGKNGKWGFYDREHNLLVKPIIDTIHSRPLSDYIVVESNGKRGLLKDSNNPLFVGLPFIYPKYEGIREWQQWSRFFIVIENGKQRLLNVVTGEVCDWGNHECMATMLLF
jgi:hypothetical protein